MDLSYMSGMSEVDFEMERNRLIREHIMSLPEDRRKVAYAMQCKIDVARMSMKPEELAVWMLREANELAQNLSDQVGIVRQLMGHQPEIKPASER